MQIIRDLEQFSPEKPVVLTQGTFDGVHLGHQKILSSVVEQAKTIDGVSVLLTFYPHPRLVLYPEDNDLKLITTIDEKAELLAAFGIDYLVIIPFTMALSRIDPYNFIRDILVDKLRIKTIIIGYDHRFGKNREGSIKEIKAYSEKFNYSVQQIPEQDINDCIVSSSMIRKALLSGRVDEASDFLGQPFSINGKVTEGQQVGTKIGFPTANISIEDKAKLIPKKGVYAVRVELQGQLYDGMLNIGHRPTVDGKGLTVEVHIFNCSDDIYGQDIRILFVKRWRDELKFEQLADLQQQLQSDQEQIQAYLK